MFLFILSDENNYKLRKDFSVAHRMNSSKFSAHRGVNNRGVLWNSM